jgi:hypothetical protein
VIKKLAKFLLTSGWHGRCFIVAMMHKQNAMTLTEAWPQTGWFKSHLREIVAHLKQIVEIPTGYQDESGFHRGTEPARGEIQWPPA